MDSREKVSIDKALTRLQNLCARQEKCVWDIMQKLKLWGINNEEAQKIVSMLVDEGFVDDRRYAQMFVREKSQLNKWGSIKIAAALRVKKINESIIKEALLELQPQFDRATLENIITTKANQVKAKSPSDLRAKLVRFGLSRGFELEHVVKTVDMVMKSNMTDEA
ncbi:MAG: RecX family transcriptional regulator [Bacteroidales bacterium]|mgnify:FL=1|jgi:regulatory protein|nr:RecX family transcriptional regulator [Bacteroidales bacterium]HOA10043.1 regulatory protein RecX [Tenuifilaceae bacterium]MBP8642434.1 RecX family transcriptional regulator [Bacteroidales bacterium]NLI87421.1 RecX family transcriptional regulator [Bacteroidales bacterium]HOC35537.1 regulatory protein RecX [Tenuifilaceae bacterium]